MRSGIKRICHPQLFILTFPCLFVSKKRCNYEPLLKDNVTELGEK